MIVGGKSKLDQLMKDARGPAALSLTGSPTRKPSVYVPDTPLQRKAAQVRRQAAAAGRQLVGTELFLSLSACAEANRASTLRAARAPRGIAGKKDIIAAVRKAGLRA
jgi:hypothetical protein